MKNYQTPFGERQVTKEDFDVYEQQLRTLVTSSSHPDWSSFQDTPENDEPDDLRDYGYYIEEAS